MYNSITVSIVMKCIHSFQEYYQYSLLKKFTDKLRPIKDVYEESYIYKTINREGVFENSLLFKIYYGFFYGLNSFFTFLNKKLISPIRNSLFLGSFEEIFRDLNSFVAFIFSIFLYSGLFSMLTSIIARKNFKLSFLIFILGFIGRLFRNKYKIILENSKILNFFLEFFKLDKDGEPWW